MYGYMYIYNIFLMYWIYIYIYTWNLGAYFLFQGRYYKQILQKNRKPRIPSNQSRRHQRGYRQIHIYIYAYMLFLYGIRVPFQHSRTHMATLNHSYQRNQTLNMQIFPLCLFSSYCGDFFNNHFESQEMDSDHSMT